MNMNEKIDTATFGTGCFWCTEAIFEQLNGVLKVISGYSNGQAEKMKKNLQVGEVLELRGKKAVVKIGLLPMHVNLENLVLIREKN